MAITKDVVKMELAHKWRGQKDAQQTHCAEGLTDDDGARAALVQGCCWCIRAIRSIIFMQLWIVTEQAPPITQGSTG